MFNSFLTSAYKINHLEELKMLFYNLPKSLHHDEVEEHGFIFHNLLVKCTSTHHFDELKELNNGRVEEVVSHAIGHEGLHDWCQKVVPHNVTVVELILQTYYPSTEPHSSCEGEAENRDVIWLSSESLPSPSFSFCLWV